MTSYWTVSEEPGALAQFELRGKERRVTPQPLGAGAGAEEMAPVIVCAQSAIAVNKARTGDARAPVLLQGAGRGGVLWRSSAALRFFRTVTAAEELPFPGGAYTIPPSNLEPDVTLYAEAASASEVTLTLELAHGGKAETKVKAVELTMDGGPAEFYAGTTAESRRRVAVLPVEPRSFGGRLTLRSTPSAFGLRERRRRARIHWYCWRARRTAEARWTAVTPAGVKLHWSVARQEDDGSVIRALSANPLPSLRAAGEGVALLTDAAGAFRVRAGAATGDGGAVRGVVDDSDSRGGDGEYD